MLRDRTAQEQQLRALISTITPYVAKRVRDVAIRDDIVQESAWRAISAAPSLEANTLTAYAIVTARNAIIAEHRREQRFRRAQPKLAQSEFDPRQSSDNLLMTEESVALRQAISEFDEPDRSILVDHHVLGKSVDELAQRHQVSTGSMAVRLARLRAKLRVDFLLTFRHVNLPTPSCKPVLLALSSGEQRQQRRLHAGDHLTRCDTCAQLAPALVERKRSLAVFAPVSLLFGAVKNACKEHPLASSSGCVTVAAATCAVLVVASQHDNTTPLAASPCDAVITMDGKTPSAGLSDSPRDGAPAVVRNATVSEVAADEGFWLQCGTFRVWAQMVGSNESPVDINSGMHVKGDGIVRAHASGFAASAGAFGPTVPELDAARYHIEFSQSAMQPQ